MNAFSRASVVESYPTTLNELLGVSGWANDMDNALSFQCPSGQSINAIVSYHHNHYEDRRWKFACKATAGITDNCSWSAVLTNCALSGNANSLDGWDRVFRFQTCSKV
nr:hypothetical protein BaRGS_033783 [Batillaria attramentaria]